MTESRQCRGWLRVTSAARSGDDHPTVEYVDGLENPAECFYNIVSWLVTHGYSDDEIMAVTGANVLRVLKQVWI